MKRRKIVRPSEYVRRVRPGAKRVTRTAIGQVFARLRRSGRVCSANVTVPPAHATVWVDRDDPWASVVKLAAERVALDEEALDLLPGLPNEQTARIGLLNKLGIAAVPRRGGCTQLIGTDPRIARIVNHIHHGRRRRQLDRREVIEAVFGLRPNGRATSVTERRLEYALDFFARNFGIDMADFIDHESLLV